MKLLEKILLATDFSTSSDNVIENAIALARIFQSEITLIYVLPDNIENEKIKLILEESSNKKLEEINIKIKSENIKIAKPLLKYGNYFDEIIQTSNDINANLIFIGAGEKLKHDRYQLGTTAEKIIRQSNKPIWVIKNENTLNVKNILCPVDFSKESKRALKNAIILAHKFKAELIVFSVYEVHNLDPPNYRLDWDEYNDFVLSAHKKEFNLFLKNLNLTDLKWKKKIEIGDPAAEILKALKRYKSDLLIIGTTGKSGLTRILMGSVTEKVIREVPCSFITLKSEDFINLELVTRIRYIQEHYDFADQLMKDGFFDESINEYKICLSINDMHIPSLNGIAKVYDKLGDTGNSEKYKNMAKEILARV